MILAGLAILVAVLLWWGSTGAILWLDGLAASTFRWSMAAATVLMAGAIYALTIVSAETSGRAAFAGFAIGLLVWGWLEIGYYLGFMVGPRRQGSPEGCRGWRHFWNAVQTTLYHEVAALALTAVIAAVTWDMPNRTALWTFQILWLMQLSAKLNVFLGVPNLAENFLPDHLAFIRSFMTRKSMNLFFPVAITLSVVLATLLIVAAATARTPFATVEATMLASLVVLAVVEHWVLVVPLPLDRLWGWSLRSRASPATAARPEVAPTRPSSTFDRDKHGPDHHPSFATSRQRPEADRRRAVAWASRGQP